MSQPELMKIPEAAALAGVSRSTAYEYMKDPDPSMRWPVVKIGSAVRIPRLELEDWIRRQVHAQNPHLRKVVRS